MRFPGRPGCSFAVLSLPAAGSGRLPSTGRIPATAENIKLGAAFPTAQSARGREKEPTQQQQARPLSAPVLRRRRASRTLTKANIRRPPVRGGIRPHRNALASVGGRKNQGWGSPPQLRSPQCAPRKSAYLQTPGPWGVSPIRWPGGCWERARACAQKKQRGIQSSTGFPLPRGFIHSPAGPGRGPVSLRLRPLSAPVLRGGRCATFPHFRGRGMGGKSITVPAWSPRI